MKIPKLKIWFQNFFKSFIWLILPLCILGDIKSCSNYIEAGTHLTPYSVNVSGYYRKDGTYIHPYTRRPAGGVKQDAPYDNQRTNMSIFFFLCLVGGVGSIAVYINMSNSEIDKQKKTLKEIEEKKLEEEKMHFIELTLKEMNFNFSELTVKPLNLKIGESGKCKFCNTTIHNNDFHISFIAVSNKHYVCINCLKKRETIGRGQFQSNYVKEIKYNDNYNNLFEEFKLKFINQLNSKPFEFTHSEIKKIFDSQLFK
jgi:hypothetical protein